MQPKSAHDGTIFSPQSEMEHCDPAAAFAEMTSVEPWVNCIRAEVRQFIKQRETSKLSRGYLFGLELLELTDEARIDRPDTLVRLGYAWCQWRVIALGFEHFSGVGKVMKRSQIKATKAKTKPRPADSELRRVLKEMKAIHPKETAAVVATAKHFGVGKSTVYKWLQNK